MDIKSFHGNGNFMYDPSIFGFSLAFWVQVVGTGAGTTGSGTSTKIRLNADRIASMVCYRYLDAEFNVLVPVAPTAGDVRRWGFSAPGDANRGRIGFDITDTAFKWVIYDNAGNLIDSKTIVWDAAWTNTETKYRVLWYNNGVRFFIGSTCVGKTQFAGSNDNVVVPSLPLPIDINNANSDNMDIGLIILKDISAWN